MTVARFLSVLQDRLRANRERVLVRIFESRSEDEPVELTGAGILEESAALVARFCRSPRQRVTLLLLPHSRELFLLHLGLVLQGRIPAILAWPTSRIDPEKYQRNLLHQLRNLPAAELLTLPGLARNLAPGLPYPVRAVETKYAGEFDRNFAVPLTVDPVERGPEPAGAPEGALFLQFSGGTTGAQKCVVVTAEMLHSQFERLGECLQFGEGDGVASWLPLYHDMGLIACLWFPLWHGAPSVQISAADWLMDPAMLFRAVARYQATFCWLPNFAFSYLAGQRVRMREEHGLGRMRAWINCSEPVRLRSMNAFAETFQDWGVRPNALQASYAMAENVFAVTQTALGTVPSTFPRGKLVQSALQLNRNAYDIVDEVYVSSGRALKEMEVRVRGPSGANCAEAEPGGIEIRSQCLFRGYWGTGGFTTTAILEDGWYATGDFGFFANDELYVIGRTKDIVIVGGQNLFPEDVEALVNKTEGVYPGRVVAFGVQDEEQGTESLAVVAELRGGYERDTAVRLERDVSKSIIAAMGVAARYVWVVPERWIVKSTAGKISRRETRNRFSSELRAGRGESAGVTATVEQRL